MRILIITPYVTIDSRPEFCRNKTGFGYMVYDIARAVAEREQVEVLASDVRGEEFVLDNIRFLKRSFGLFFKNIFCCLPFKSVWRLRSSYFTSWETFIRLVYYWLISGYYMSIIKKGDVDIVHIHGCSYATDLWIQVCKQCNHKFLVTLHGLNSFSDTVRISAGAKRYEQDFLKRVIDGEFPITVISTGMKRLIEKTFGVEDCKSISVVCNSFSFSLSKSTNRTDSIRKRYNIPEDRKVLLYVGNISENKNQRQMVESYGVLPDDLRNSTWVLFCGKPSADGSFEKFIEGLPFDVYGRRMILCGSVDKNEMPDYYMEADGVVLLSKSEGFGLSLIEGMHFGVPCAMYSDLDAFVDIYDKMAVVTIEQRNNKSVAEALQVLLSKSWNKEEIIHSSKRFETKAMASNYKKVYELL